MKGKGANGLYGIGMVTIFQDGRRLSGLPLPMALV